MKAHIALRPVLLCCQLPEKDLETVKAISRALKFEVKTVERADAGKTAGSLCGLPGSPAMPVAVVGEMTRQPVLVLYQFSDSKMDSFLAALKGSGLNIPLKAALTAINKSWPFCQLAAELEKEHAALKNGAPLHED